MNGGDVTRSTFRASRHYSGVRMQQGRVQLDADWNEQLDLSAHRDRSEALDVIGSVGIPKVAGGFGITVSPDGDDLLLTRGRAWVGGHLCEIDGELTDVTDLVSATSVTVASVVLGGSELVAQEWVEVIDSFGDSVVARLEAVDVAQRTLTLSRPIDALTGTLVLSRRTSYALQPDLPAPESTTRASSTDPRVLDLPEGTWLAFLDVWERAVTALDDPTIAEPALGVDTTTRSKVIWQVRLLDLADVPPPADCDTNLGPALADFAPASGRMAARAEPPPGSADLCRPTPAGGYVGLENQLYRVQVYDVAAGRPVFVWSRENGSVVTRWLSNVAADVLGVSSIGRDAVLGFKPGDWVELYDDSNVLHRRLGTLVRLLNAKGTQLTLDPATATGSTDITDFPANAQVRRWDSPGPVTATGDDWIPLEDGVEVRFPVDGTFHLHDYWLVPARSAQADVDWPRDSARNELAQLPCGVEHSVGKLAIITQTAGTISVLDCRDLFPALTALAATDVTVGNDTCNLPGVETVQDAIDALCRANDLRRHNKLLHGWGIVCGLAVHCGDRTAQGPDGNGADPADAPPRRFVTVEAGAAIDCEGNDLDVAEPIVVDVLTELRDLGEGVLDAEGDGEVCLVLRTDPGGGPRVAVRKYQEPKAGAYLEDTLLMDIWNDCIAKLYSWIKAQLEPKGGQPKEDQAAYRLRTALSNLATYPADPKSGGTVFVSASEDKLLRTFHEGLRKRLRSETFCAMFDDARLYPDYPHQFKGIRTISGSGWHGRVRVHPSGTQAYTVGSGVNPLQPASLIHRYDLVNETLVARIDPVSGNEVEPGGKGSTSTAAVTDVAFSSDGRRIYAAMPTRDGNDTLFRVGEISDQTIKWLPATTICGVRLVTLATTAADPENVYAVGVRRLSASTKGWKPREYTGAGIFQIPAGNVPDGLTAMAGTETLNTVGHLLITPTGLATFTCGTAGASATSYNSLVSMTLPDGTVTASVSIEQGSDDIVLAEIGDVGRRRRSVLWTVVGSGTDRSLVGFNQGGLEQVTEPFVIEGAEGAISLAAVGSRIIVTDSDSSLARVFEAGGGRLNAQAAGFVDGLRLPLQVGPASVSTPATRPPNIVALNRVSNSLSVIDLEVFLGKSFDLAPLTAYRRGAVEAFADLLGGFLQYLKDCICDHLLVSCPECPEDKDLDLAAVSIRGNSVYKVCNWSRRKYVKSFPTVGYWLSMVPVLPFLREQLGKLCGTILTESFGRYDTAGHDNAGRSMQTQAILRLLEIAQEEDPLTRLRKGRQSAMSVSSLAFAGRWDEAANRVRARGGPDVQASVVGSNELAALTSRLEALETELAQLKSK